MILSCSFQGEGRLMFVHQFKYWCSDLRLIMAGVVVTSDKLIASVMESMKIRDNA